jgi:chorismate mutase
LRAARFGGIAGAVSDPKAAPAHVSSAAAGPDMGALRAEIDAIDRDLARLIARRSGLAAFVASAKRANGDTGFGWRPAREVEILRMVRVAEPGIDPVLAGTIWRAMIAANLAAQGGLSVATVAGCEASARALVGDPAFVSLRADADACLAAAAGEANTLAALPDPSHVEPGAGLPWWVLLQAPRYARLHVCAASPQTDTGQRPEALVLAARQPEPAGHDISLVLGPRLSLAPLGGTVLAEAAGLELHEIRRFVTPDEATGPGVRLVGAYALA